jgi:hypothetical protein
LSVAQFHNTFQGDNYGDINQAGRDINVTTYSSLDALKATGDLRTALRDVGLGPEDRRIAQQELDDVERELREPSPDRETVARKLNGLTETLKAAGAFAAAGAALFGPIGVIAGFLGPLGEAIVELARE